MPQKHDTIQNMYRKYRMYTFLTLMLLVSALLLTFINRYLTLTVLGIAALWHLFAQRPLQKQYLLTFTQYNLENTLCRYLGADAPSEHAGGYITADTILQSELMPCRIEKNSPLLCWQLKGCRKGISIALCDATIAQDFKLADKGKKRVHFNSGVWAHIDLGKDSGKRFLLFDETSVPTPIRMDFFSKEKTQYETASLGDDSLGKRFVLYRPVDEPDQIPSASFLQSLKRLVNYTPGYLAISINGTQIDIFLRGRFLAKAVSLSQKPDQKQLEFDPFPELSYLIELAYSVNNH